MRGWDLGRGVGVELDAVAGQLGGDGAGELRLAAAGRAVEKHAAGGLHAQVRVDLGVRQRVLDQLPHVLPRVHAGAGARTPPAWPGQVAAARAVLPCTGDDEVRNGFERGGEIGKALHNRKGV